MSETISLVATVLGVISIIASALLWLRTAYRKEYASERAIAHVRIDIQTLSGEIVRLEETIERLEREMIRQGLVLTPHRGTDS